MTRRSLTFVAFSLLAMSACKKEPNLDVSPSLSAADTSLVASLERGPCRGSCPAYKVEVWADGRVRFDGVRSVATIGMRRGTTTPAAIKQLMKSVAVSEFATADTAYVMDSKGCGSYATDLPVSKLTFRVGTKLKTIEHDPGCRNAPRFLKTLEAQVDTAAKSALWIVGNGEKK